MTRKKSSRVKLSLSRYVDTAAPWIDERAVDILARIAEASDRAEGTLSVIVVDDTYIQKLNREYRGNDRPTDVLSFSYLDESHATDDNVIGEVYVSHETLERDAEAGGINPGNLFVRIGVHGMLHVLGYDHETETDALRMENKERKLLTDHMTASDVEALF
jgi:probable rRNA maturation factor